MTDQPDPSASPAPVDTVWGDTAPNGPCAICGDPRDHDGRPHSQATGDGRTRADLTHQLDTTGCCVETCRHPLHDGPVMIAMDLRLKDMLDDWISDLDLRAEYVPAAPDDERLRTYMVVVPPNHPLNRATAFSGLKPRPAERGVRR